MSLVLRTAVLSDVGRVREGNEDAAVGGPRLAAVADGMGGHAAGEVASQIAISVLRELENSEIDGDVIATLRETLQQANAALRDAANQDKKREGMGTTVTALLAHGDRLGLVHIGDSRAYLLRGGELAQVTHDQTYVQMLVDSGKITPEQAYEHPQRNVVLQSLDGDPDIDPEVSIREAVLGDRWLLCSDGLSGVVDYASIQQTLLIPDREQAAQRLVDLALAAGAPDNVTVVIADVEEDDDPDETPSVAGAAAPTKAPPAPHLTPFVPTSGAIGRRATESVARRRPLLARIYVIPAATFVIIALLLAAAGTYVNSQYYLGVSHGRVTVYHGLPSLSRVATRTEVDAVLLDDATRGALAHHTISGNRKKVYERLRDLMAEACLRPKLVPGSCAYFKDAKP